MVRITAQTNVNIRMDMETKKAFDEFCSEIGLSVSAAFNIFAKTVVREQRIPFALTTETPNSVTLAAIKKVDDMKCHPELCKGYQNVDWMMEDASQSGFGHDMAVLTTDDPGEAGSS